MLREEMLALRGEVKMQCFRGMNEGEELERRLSARRIRYNKDDPAGAGRALVAFTVDIWTRAHGVLSAGGAIGRILWPNPPSTERPRTHAAKVRQETARAACARAEEIWRTWPMPAPESLAPLQDRHARNAMEHAENGAPAWIASFGPGIVHAYGVGISTEARIDEASCPYFRYLFVDTLDVRIGKDEANLRRIVGSLNALQGALPFDVELQAGGLELIPTDPREMLPGVRDEAQ